MKPERFESAQDLFDAQAALMRWAQVAGHCNYLHKGDIGHRLYNNCFGYDPAEVFRLWRDQSGDLQAFAFLAAHRESFELQVAPSLLCGDAHRRLWEFCEGETLRLAARHNLRLSAFLVEGSACNPAYQAFLEARGYKRGELFLIMTRHDLRHLPEAPLPAGFRFHQATAADAARLADVHNHSFANKWDARSYGQVFAAPHMEREMTVMAPDGRCAAFANIWRDAVNRSLLFEPVGTHSAFRRRGLAKALMAHVLRRMPGEWGIERAFVCHEPPEKNPASSALYASLGFQPIHEFHEYRKPV